MSIPPIANKLLGPALGAGYNWLGQQRALDAAVMAALTAAVKEFAPDQEWNRLDSSQPSDTASVGGLLEPPWAEWAATVLAQTAVDFEDDWKVAVDPYDGLAAALETAWQALSQPDQDPPLSNAAWRHNVAARTIDLLPQMLEGTLPDAGAARRIANVLSASRNRAVHEVLREVRTAVHDLTATQNDRERFGARLDRLPRSVEEWLRKLVQDDEGSAAAMARRLAEGSPRAAVQSIISNAEYLSSAGPFAWLAVADLAAAHGMHSEAVSAYEHAVACGAPDSWRFLALGAVLILDSQRAKAEGLLTRAAAEGGHGKQFVDVVRALADKDYDRLIRVTESIGDDNPDAVFMLGYRAQVLWMQDRIDEAIESLEQALALRPESTSVALVAAQLYLNRASSDLGQHRSRDLERARKIALLARDERRRWGGDSGEALQYALASLAVEDEWDAIKRLAVVGLDVECGPSEMEAARPGVQHAVFMAALGTMDTVLAESTVGAMTDSFERTMSAGMMAWLLDADRDRALANFRRAWEEARNAQEHLRVQHALAAIGEREVNAAGPPPEDAKETILAMAEMAEGHYQEAIARLRPLRNEMRSAARALAEAYRASGDVENAIKTLDTAATRFSDSSLTVLATEMLYVSEDLEGVLDRVDRLASRVDSPTQTRRMREFAAQAAGRLGHWEAVLDYSRALLESDPQNILALWATVAGHAHLAP